jgi:predicted DNA-binding protein
MATANETRHTSYRLPAQIKSMLNTLAAVDNTTCTNVLKRLIREAYTARHDEIKKFRESQNNTKS